MNRLIGLWSSAIVTVATFAFALSMLATWGQTFAGYSYGICMVLSWSFLVLACAMAAISRESLRAAALVGVGFAVLYSGFVTTVYFVQLTTVLHQDLGGE